MFQCRRNVQTFKMNSKHSKRQKQKREETELLEYKKRFGYYAKTETKKELPKKIQQRKLKEIKENPANCKPSNFKQNLCRENSLISGVHPPGYVENVGLINNKLDRSSFNSNRMLSTNVNGCLIRFL